MILFVEISSFEIVIIRHYNWTKINNNFSSRKFEEKNVENMYHNTPFLVNWDVDFRGFMAYYPIHFLPSVPILFTKI